MRRPGLLILAVLAALPTGCSSPSKERPALEPATLALADLPPPRPEPVRAPRPLLVVTVEGLDATLCKDLSSLPEGPTRTLLSRGCRPLKVGAAGVAGDRASLITGVEPGVHGVFSDARLSFGGPGERRWPVGPRRAPHAWTNLLEARNEVVSIAVPLDYPPQRADWFTAIAGWDLPAELCDGTPAEPKVPLSWPPVAMLELAEAGIILSHCRAAGEVTPARARAEAAARTTAARWFVRNRKPSLLWVSLGGLGTLPVPDLDAALDPLLGAWPEEVLLVSLRGGAVRELALPTSEEGASWTQTGALRVDSSLPPARQRGLVRRAEEAVGDCLGRVVPASSVTGPRSGLAPDLQIVPEPGARMPGGDSGTPGLVAGSFVKSANSVSAAEVGAWIPGFVGASGESETL